MTEWLVWSAYYRRWWGPNRSGYTNNLWRAGRFAEDDARFVCGLRSWDDDAFFPPEVMVPAPVPANGVGFTVDELRGLDDRVAWQVEQAGQRMVEERDNQHTTTEATRG